MGRRVLSARKSPRRKGRGKLFADGPACFSPPLCFFSLSVYGPPDARPGSLPPPPLYSLNPRTPRPRVSVTVLVARHRRPSLNSGWRPIDVPGTARQHGKAIIAAIRQRGPRAPNVVVRPVTAGILGFVRRPCAIIIP